MSLFSPTKWNCRKCNTNQKLRTFTFKVKLLPYCYNRSVSRFAAFILKANIKYTEIKCNYPPVAGLYYKACTLYPVNKQINSGWTKLLWWKIRQPHIELQSMSLPLENDEQMLLMHKTKNLDAYIWVIWYKFVSCYSDICIFSHY